MKFIILGNGFLSKSIQKEFKKIHQPFIVFDKINSPFIYSFEQNNWICDINKFYEYPHIFDYKIIINCIGKSDTRWCELPQNFDELIIINSLLPKFLSIFCNARDLTYIHISTGCLYDQRGQGKCNESTFISAHCNYTLSKWLAEGYLNKKRDIILRPRLLFGGIKCENRNNLIQKIPKFNQFLNEFNSVTSCETIAHSIIALCKNNITGEIFNVSNDGVYTIADIAKFMGIKNVDKNLISQEDLHKSQNLFLVNNVLDISKLKQYYIPNDTLKEVKIRMNELLNE